MMLIRTASAWAAMRWGAGGSCSDASQSATAGLAGGPGIVIVYEFN